ncbi:hypothetical protein [Paenibacillus sp. FSL L8-0709]|uniref:hypothetical protein n=1 Tax=Paenibacillus sp. FSL L8-0709 TaxID=2975312 RepID=UPI0030F88771
MTTNSNDSYLLTTPVGEGQLSLFTDEWFTPSKLPEGKQSVDNCGSDSSKAKGAAGKRKISEIKHTPKTPPIPVLESIKLGEGWKVHYSANTYKVDFLFLEEGRNNVESVTLEDIRLKLLIEEDAAELTASGTKWRYDIDQKLLFPDAWGEDKGLC